MKRGRPPSPYQTQIPPVDRVIGMNDHDEGDPMPHEIDHAVHTLTKAQEIQNNPKMMKHVHEAMGTKITSLKQLRKMAQKMSQPKSDNDAPEQD